MLHRLSCSLQRSQVNTSIVTACHNCLQLFGSHDVAMNKVSLFKKIFPEASLQIVEHRHFVSFVKKSSCNMAANIAGAPDNQNSHKKDPLL